MAIKPPNPKYIPKPYEKMFYPGQRVQIDVKVVPTACIVGDAEGEKVFQYTAIDEYSRFRYIEAFQEQSTYSSTIFLEHMLKAFPFKVECVQTDNGVEFTKRLLPTSNPTPTLFETSLKQRGITHKLIRPYTPRHKYQFISEETFQELVNNKITEENPEKTALIENGFFL